MSDGELFSLTLRMFGLVGACALSAALAQWNMFGPSWAACGIAVTVFVSICIDLARKQ